MRLIMSSIMAGVIALGATAPAFADPPRHHHDRGWTRDHRDWRNDRRDWRHDRRDWRDDRRHYRDGYRDGRRDARHWRKGDRFDHRHASYVVIRDYDRYYDRRGHRLPPPRYGQYYVRNHDTGDILLIAAATGLVLWALTD